MKSKLLFIITVFLALMACNGIKSDVPIVIELIDLDYHFSINDLVKFSDKNHINPQSIYQWQNHWIIFDKKINVEKIVSKLEKQFPRLKIKTYEKPFYNFNRQQITKENPTKEWEHIIMTANLVSDTTLQNEYMEYHKTQFEKWPEISKGFCNADFQQLLVYRSGRQLMLVISIPKGKTLDELNPKTTENNPRVDEWNKIMAKYQEGIEDAPKGTTWVAFSPLNPPQGDF